MKPHPWFNAPYRRWLTVAFCFGWAALEGWRDTSSIWFWVVGALAVFSVYHFFFAGIYPYEEE